MPAHEPLPTWRGRTSPPLSQSITLSVFLAFSLTSLVNFEWKPRLDRADKAERLPTGFICVDRSDTQATKTRTRLFLKVRQFAFFFFILFIYLCFQSTLFRDINNNYNLVLSAFAFWILPGHHFRKLSAYKSFTQTGRHTSTTNILYTVTKLQQHVCTIGCCTLRKKLRDL